MMLSKDDILRGLENLDVKAKAAELLVDLSIYGGAALAIAFDMRLATRDVDAVVNGSPDFLRKAVAEVAEEQGWPIDWLNDGVKGFISENEKMNLMDSFRGDESCGLRISLPSPEYLFAMKCMAMRPEGIEGSSDISDIIGLAHICSIQTNEQAFGLVESFYPAKQIPAKVRFGLEEIMEKISPKASSGMGEPSPATPPSLGGGVLNKKAVLADSPHPMESSVDVDKSPSTRMKP